MKPMASSRVPQFATGGLACALLVAAGSAGLAAPPARASTTSAIRGQWILEPGDKSGTVHLTIQRSAGKHSQMSSSSDLPASIVQGLDWKQASSATGAAQRFQIVRDAGVFDCEGWFRDGKGSGHYDFSPNPPFVSEMGRLGYSSLTDEKVFTLAVHDVSRALIRDYAALGYQRVPMDDLVAMRIHGASPAYIRDLAALGYQHLAIDTLVAMRIHGVSPELIRRLGALGYTRLDAQMLIDMRIHGVSPEFVDGLRTEGYRQVPADKLVAMRIHGVSPEFIRRLKDRGYTGLSVDELVELRIHGVAN